MFFFGKQWFLFKKAMFFDTTLHIIFFDYKAFAFYNFFFGGMLCDAA